MRNLKVSMKLIVCFLAVIVLAAAVGVTGIIGMSSISTADTAMYNNNYLPTVLAGDIAQKVQEQRSHIRSIIIFDSSVDVEDFAKAVDSLNATKADLEKLLDEYALTITNPEDQAAFDQFVEVYENEWIPALDNMQELGMGEPTPESKAALIAAGPIVVKLDAATSTLQDVNLSDGKLAVEANAALSATMTIVEIAVLVAAVAIALFFSFYLTKLIAKPLAPLTSFMTKAGTVGDITLAPDDQKLINQYAQVKDEIGQTISATASFVARITEVSEKLGTISNGDLTVDIKPLSEHDVLGLSTKKMTDNLNQMFGDINLSSMQVSTGASQVADGAQALAQGATEQAASVEELSSSIAEVAESTKANAQKAETASNLANTIKANAEKGSSQMEEMITAVKEINQSSQDISKVIKVIDDIAFQTNILALNAAVEAARAGQHGKGFAVVAEEVRNLAAKSAEAASSTENLIANSRDKAELGVRIADDTAASLTEIVSGINESSKLVAEITTSSEEQSAAISEINIGIDQVAQVVQQNSATAEESAAAAEEMSGQSGMLRELIAQFKVKGDANGEGAMMDTGYERKQLSAPEDTGFDSSASFGGKY